MKKNSPLAKCCLTLISIWAPIARSVAVTRSFKKVSIAKNRQILTGSLVTSEAGCLAQMGNRTEQSLTDYHAATYDRESKKCQLIELNMTATPGGETVDLMIHKDSEGSSTLRSVLLHTFSFHESVGPLRCVDNYPGFEWFGKSGYRMVKTSLSFSNSRSYCRSFNADLPTVLNQDEADTLRAFVDKGMKNIEA